MLIVTQEKSGIVNLESVEVIFIEPETACFRAKYGVFARGMNGKNMMLGRYENKTRAKEVLQKIAEKYDVRATKPVYEMPEA